MQLQVTLFFTYFHCMSGQKYQHPKNKDENDWMPSSCLTNKITRFCYNFLLKFKFAAATKQEAFLFVFFEAKIRKKGNMFENWEELQQNPFAIQW